MGAPEIVAISLAVLILFGRGPVKALGEDLNEGIINFVNSFRGGPPPPTHPSPANDGVLLRRRSQKVAP